MKPVRTALFAPGIKERVMTKALESGADAVILAALSSAGLDKERVMTKALESGADAVILDLEDSVPVSAKAEARALVAKAIDAAAAASHPAIYVRVNAAITGLLIDDLDAVARPGLDAILLSKAENVGDVQQAAAALERHESQRGMKPGSAEIILQIENALGVYNCFNLIKASPRVVATCFGSARDGDLQTDLGCSWSIEGT